MPNMTPEDFEALLSQLGQSPSGGDGLAPTAPGSAIGLGSLPASSLPPMPSQATPQSVPRQSFTPAPSDISSLVSQTISKKYGASPLADDEALLASQTLGQANRNAANMGAAFATFAHGLSMSKAPIDNTAFKNMSDQADDETKNVIQRRQAEIQNAQLAKEQEAADPNSPIAQNMRQIYSRFNIPTDMLNNLSAAQMKNYLELPLSQQAKMASLEAMKAQTLEMQREKGAKAKGDKDTKRFTNLGDALDENKGRTGEFGRQIQYVNNADRVLALRNQFPDGNLPPAQMGELASASANLIGGGSGAAEATIERFVPHTFSGSAAGISQWLTSEPRGAGQQAFAKQMFDTAEREKALAQGKVKAVKYSRVAQFADLQKNDPETFDAVLRSHDIDPDEYSAYKKNGYKSQTTAPAVQAGSNPLEDEMRKRGLLK